ncbi:hypothetical protein SAMN05216404_1019 [Nitrosospira multiformis]|uniref:Uncharacterized protein n=1 Tax=Nitrosospira multiformis TaxID=1231 RepID=A0A1H8ASC4_9PROT|nr:hypothetical protein [Nitrosospira multiformis]SEM73426.1 hypothetical protein SAMN05216404_1019 [Nitrosospira multiformis]
MENILILKKLAQSAVLAGVITFSAAGVAQAAGAGEQTGEYGDMSKHGKGSNAPEPRGYQQSGSGSGEGSGQGGYDKPHDKRHDMHDKSYEKEKRSGQGGGSQGGGSSGQSGGGGY